MKQFVVLRDMSAGNESIGEMWVETKVFDGQATLSEVMKWADKDAIEQSGHSRKNIRITVAHED